VEAIKSRKCSSFCLFFCSKGRCFLLNHCALPFGGYVVMLLHLLSLLGVLENDVQILMKFLFQIVEVIE
jgi:hypothetical protein